MNQLIQNTGWDMRVKLYQCKICRKPIGDRRMARKHLGENHIRLSKTDAKDFMVKILEHEQKEKR